ncbi:hypothetical protein OROMI_002707 [Orobanche minor]
MTVKNVKVKRFIKESSLVALILSGCECSEHVRRLWEIVEKGHESNRYKREGKGYQMVSMMIVFFFIFILEGDFRGVLQGNANNEMEICLESEILLCKSLMGAIWFVAAGSDPFDVITNAVKKVDVKKTLEIQGVEAYSKEGTQVKCLNIFRHILHCSSRSVRVGTNC